MDYKDFQRGQSQDNFWFRGKRGMIETVLHPLAGKNRKILNIGAGTGEDLEIIKKFGEVYVIDIDKNALKMIPEGLCKEKKEGDARKLPYKDNFFEIVVAFDVLEHIKEEDDAVSEVCRVLKKNGDFIFSVPAFQSLYSSHDKALGHERRYSKERLKRILSKFRKINLGYWNCFLFPAMALFRLANRKSAPKVNSGNSIKVIDNILFSILKFENWLLANNFSLPFGMSIIGKCKK